MRFSKILSLMISSLSLVSVASAAPAAGPVGSISGPGASVATADAAPVVDVIADSLFRPIAAVPGKEGTVRFDSDGRCILAILGGSAQPEMLRAILTQGKRASTRGLGKDFFALLLCGNADGNVDAILANQKGLKSAVSGAARVKQGSLFAAKFDTPNTIVSVGLANTHGNSGGKFLTEDYELVVGVDGEKHFFVYIADKVGGKIVAYNAGVGGYVADWNEQTQALYARVFGRTIISTPKIIVAN